MSVEFRALRENEREEAIELWRTVWPGDNSRSYFSRYLYGDVEWLPYYTQVAVDEGRIVSAVQICKRTVACGEFRLTMGGIANVATLPEFRGKGYNSECMRRAIRVMEADAMDFSLLFTGITDYYARLGYSTLTRMGLSGSIRPDFAPRETAYAVRQALPDDLPEVRAIYDEYNVNRPLAVQRCESYWRDWLQITPERIPDMLYVARDAEGVVHGYAQCGTFRSAKPYNADEMGVRVTEFGSLQGPWEADVTAALFEAIAAQLVAHGSRQMRLDLAFEPAVLAALDRILERPEWHRMSSGMARLLHPENLLSSFTLLLNERWIAARRPRGILQFRTPYGGVRLDASHDFLRVSAAEEAVDDLAQETLLELFFGSLGPEQTAAAADLHPLMHALFPLQAPVFWGADGF